jgi:heptosyltransferase I
MPHPANNFNSICVLRLSAIGDVCHAVATLQAIQRAHPNAKITWVIGKIEARLLADLPNVEFIEFDKRAGLKGYRDLFQKLKGRKFDVLLHMQVALRASLATLCIKAKQKWGFDRVRAKEGQWIFTNRKIQPQKDPHVADGFFAFAKAIGTPHDEVPKWNMPVPREHKDWAANLLGERRYMVISPAASKAERNWLIERYAEVSDYASANGLKVVLSGGPTSLEKQLAVQIENLVQQPVINLVGKTSLPQLLAVIANAEFVIAPDSGPAHMATTVNTPVIGLYAHSNPSRTGPYHSLNTTISVYEELLKQQTGKTVNQNPWGKRVKGESLMALITVDAVKQKMDLLFNASDKNSEH